MGVGGGVLLVPAMVLLLGFDQHKAHGTSLAVIIPIVACAAVSYCLSGNVFRGVAGGLAVGGVVGAMIGARLAAALPSKKLRVLFGLFILATSLKMLWDAGHAVSAVHATGPFPMALVIPTGIAAGVLSGLMGVGGGIIMIPMMIYLLHIDQKVAQGISLLVIIPVSISGALIHMRKGNVDLRYGKWLALGGVMGSALGGSLAQLCRDSTLRLIFGLFLMAMAGLTLRKR
jgi:uncharacterized protein